MFQNQVRMTILLSIPASLASCATDYPYGPGSGWGHMMYYGYGGGLMWVLFLMVIGVLVYVVIQSAKTKGSARVSGETPLDILKKRYAKGELTKDEFESMKKDLSE